MSRRRLAYVCRGRRDHGFEEEFAGAQPSRRQGELTHRPTHVDEVFADPGRDIPTPMGMGGGGTD